MKTISRKSAVEVINGEVDAFKQATAVRDGVKIIGITQGVKRRVYRFTVVAFPKTSLAKVAAVAKEISNTTGLPVTFHGPKGSRISAFARNGRISRF